MKKIFIAALLLLSTSFLYAQDASSILKDYLAKVGLASHKDQTMRLEMEMDVQGTTVPITISYPKNQTDMRIDMTMQGNDMSFVIVGETGWLESGDQCQDLPADFIAQTRQMTLFTSVSDLSAENLEYLEKVSYNSVDYHKIRASRGNESYTVWFDAATGLVCYIDTVSQGASVRICFSDYKKFGDVFLPSLITTAGIPQMVSKVRLEIVSFNIDIPQWYFERP